MLKQRVYTAVALVVPFITILFLGSWLHFTCLAGVVVGLAAWEWAGLAGLKTPLSRAVFTAFIALSGALIGWFLQWTEHHQNLQTLLIAASIWWAVALLWVQGYPSSAIIWGSTPVRLVMGWFVLVPAWLALVYLRSEPAGSWLVLMAVFTVAAADIGAYFTGRAFGRTKLAKNVSPGKTWEGVVGGLCFALALGAVANVVIIHGNWLALVAVILPTALVSVLGDLLESMVKRHQGVKDSGALLPGHGGFMDRIDGLVAAAPIFALAVLSTQWTVKVG
ncbi:phosphatidate cytidylyltransferase [Teredinibacter haidensis]|uniref:phosphatidate cytidylyltransferase n=1 Tax=Teredinibacter haidensis TaxID=2731755 RepID=UPI000948C253|nr:phosphatidate cytidylyltransferase [Teredinibacter haidensis]